MPESRVAVTSAGLLVFMIAAAGMCGVGVAQEVSELERLSARARAAAMEVQNPETRNLLLYGLAEDQVRTSLPDDAVVSLAQVNWSDFDDGYLKATLLERVALAFVDRGDLDKALAVADQPVGEAWEDHVREYVARRLMEQGKLPQGLELLKGFHTRDGDTIGPILCHGIENAHREDTAILLGAIQTAITDESTQDFLLRTLASAQVKRGDVASAMTTAAKIRSARERVHALAMIASVEIRAGRSESGAKALADAELAFVRADFKFDLASVRELLVARIATGQRESVDSKIVKEMAAKPRDQISLLAVAATEYSRLEMGDASRRLFEVAVQDLQAFRRAQKKPPMLHWEESPVDDAETELIVQLVRSGDLTRACDPSWAGYPRKCAISNFILAEDWKSAMDLAIVAENPESRVDQIWNVASNAVYAGALDVAEECGGLLEDSMVKTSILTDVMRARMARGEREAVSRLMLTIFSSIARTRETTSTWDELIAVCETVPNPEMAEKICRELSRRAYLPGSLEERAERLAMLGRGEVLCGRVEAGRGRFAEAQEAALLLENSNQALSGIAEREAASGVENPGAWIAGLHAPDKRAAAYVGALRGTFERASRRPEKVPP